MTTETTISGVIIDYGMGNLFSIKHACEQAGIDAVVTSDVKALMQADIAILPGVGAFGDAMKTLHSLDLVEPVRDFAATGKPLVGICLGQQILLEESTEFGSHKGLGLIPGRVVRFDAPKLNGTALKVPHVGWNRLWDTKGEAAANKSTAPRPARWTNTPLRSIGNGAYMYFVHSYYAVPNDDSVVLTWTSYGNTIFCSSLIKDNIIAFQHHPERSAADGLSIYDNIKTMTAAFKGYLHD